MKLYRTLIKQIISALYVLKGNNTKYKGPAEDGGNWRTRHNSKEDALLKEESITGFIKSRRLVG